MQIPWGITLNQIADLHVSRLLPIALLLLLGCGKNSPPEPQGIAPANQQIQGSTDKNKDDDVDSVKEAFQETGKGFKKAGTEMEKGFKKAGKETKQFFVGEDDDKKK